MAQSSQSINFNSSVSFVAFFFVHFAVKKTTVKSRSNTQFHFALFLLSALLVSNFSVAQTTEIIKIKKEDALYFFQVASKSDTISLNKNDLFYFKITGKLRCEARIEVVNGKLLKTKNDSIFQLKKMQNLQYEHYFQDSTFVANKTKTQNQNCHKFITHINGANEGDGNTITIQIYNINTRETLLSNKFYYR